MKTTYTKYLRNIEGKFDVETYAWAQKRQANVPGEIDGTDWKATAEHVDDFHRKIETAGRFVQADANIGRRQKSWVVSGFEPRRVHFHLDPRLLLY